MNSIFNRPQIPIIQQKPVVVEKNQTNQKVRETSKFEKPQDVPIVEENKNSLANKAKDYFVDKRADKSKKIDLPKNRIGKDNLRI